LAFFETAHARNAITYFNHGTNFGDMDIWFKAGKIFFE
jgi:hypothetical protein